MKHMQHWHVMMQPGVHFMTCFLVIMLDDAHDHVFSCFKHLGCYTDTRDRESFNIDLFNTDI
jgi:hypothetical protein